MSARLKAKPEAVHSNEGFGIVYAQKYLTGRLVVRTLRHMDSAVLFSKPESNMSAKKTAADFRIEQIQKATVNGKAVKLFSAYEKRGDAFVHIGKFTAPAKTANKNLWEIAAAAE